MSPRDLPASTLRVDRADDVERILARIQYLLGGAPFATRLTQHCSPVAQERGWTIP
jgi:hypothetical protein